MRSVKPPGKVQGQDVTIDVQYRDGRAVGARWPMNVLSAGQGQVKVWTLSVSGTEILTIGGQAVEAYRTDLVGGAAPLTLWGTTPAPYRLIKIGVAGQPVEFVRV